MSDDKEDVKENRKENRKENNVVDIEEKEVEPEAVVLVQLIDEDGLAIQHLAIAFQVGTNAVQIVEVDRSIHIYNIDDFFKIQVDELKDLEDEEEPVAEVVSINKNKEEE